MYDNDLNEDNDVVIEQVEFYLDSLDPGQGKAINISLSNSSDSIATSFSIDAKELGLELGKHSITSRVRDNYGNWSFNHWEYFDLCTIDGPKAGFDLIISGNDISLLDSSQNATEYLWKFGDGDTSLLSLPTHKYIEPDIYEIWQYAKNECGIDSISKSITIIGVESYRPQMGGNSGNVSLTIHGAGFDESSQISLEGEETIATDTFYVSNGGKTLIAVFDLLNKIQGDYVLTATINNETFEHPDNFQLVNDDDGAKPWVEIVGFPSIRRGAWQTYQIKYGNSGLVDAIGVPLWIEVLGDTSTMDIELGVNYLYMIDSVEFPQITQTADYLVLDSTAYFDGEDVKLGISYPLILPVIGSQEEGIINLKIRTSNQIEIETWVNPPLFSSPMSQATADCALRVSTTLIKQQLESESEKYKGELMEEIEKNFDDYIPGVSCVKGIYDLAMASGNRRVGDSFFNKKYLYNVLKAYSSSVLECTGGVAKSALKLGKIGYRYIKVMRKINRTTDKIDKFNSNVDNTVELLEAAKDCYNTYQGYNAVNKITLPVFTAFDPNDKLGMLNTNGEPYVTGLNPLSYIIRYENVDTADIPASEVFIIDTLDLKTLDIKTLSLGRMEFNEDFSFQPPTGLLEYFDEVDMRPKTDLIVRVNAKLDTNTSILKWHFMSLDPQTMELTESPFLGFLPPNVDKGEGEGFVSFSIEAIDSLSSATVISNFADIIFDYNEPIRTNTFQYTIDKELPSSSVLELDAVQSDTSFIVNWDGVDDFSGIKTYNVFVSENGQDYEYWKFNTESIEGVFYGKQDATYQFYSEAVDYVGNFEVPKSRSDTETRIQVPQTITGLIVHDQFINVYPNPSSGSINISFDALESCNYQFDLISVDGRYTSRLYSGFVTGSFNKEFTSPSIQKGLTILRITTDDYVKYKKVIFK